MIKTQTGLALKNKLFEGVKILSDAVSSTLGPSGKTVIIRKDDDTIQITKDGVTVAKSINKLEDPIMSIGSDLVRNVSIKSGDKVGDGTTTSVVLAKAIIEEGLKSIQAGSNPSDVKRGIDKAAAAVVKKLKEISLDVTEEEIKHVASISGNNDPSIGLIISRALDKVGNDGVVSIETSKSGVDELEIVEGLLFNRGFKSPYFVTDHERMEAVLHEPIVLIYDGVLGIDKQVINALQYSNAQNKPLLLIAEDFSSQVLSILVVNKSRGSVKVCAVKAPDFGDRKTALLEDIAVLTGGTVLSNAKGHKLEKMSVEELRTHFGECRLSTITAADTTIVDGKGKKEDIEAKMLEIKKQLDNAASNFETQNLQERLSKLTGGVAIVKVGGLSEVEMNERKDRVDDALHATKAAIEQGIVPGAGMALINCVDALVEAEYVNRDELLGMEIVKKALYSPFVTILKNAGVENYYEILSKIKLNRSGTKITLGEGYNPNHSNTEQHAIWQGYNVKTSQYVDLLKDGVIDPTKVTRTAIENAASMAGVFLTSDSCVFPVEEDSKAAEQYDMSQFGG